MTSHTILIFTGHLLFFSFKTACNICQKRMVRIPADKSKHNLENPNKYEIIYEISNIYHPQKIKFFPILLLQLQLQVNYLTSRFKEQNDEFLENMYFLFLKNFKT